METKSSAVRTGRNKGSIHTRNIYAIPEEQVDAKLSRRRNKLIVKAILVIVVILKLVDLHLSIKQFLR